MRRLIAFLTVAVLTASCGTAIESSAGTTSASTTSIATTTTTVVTVTTTTQPDTSAPWDNAPITDVPQVLIDQWGAAENKTSCSALYPDGTIDATASIRKASFSGGWGIAWDLPNGPGRESWGDYCTDCGRGAFGIAGTGIRAQGDEPVMFPSRLSWDDGSIAGYGTEGLVAPETGAPLVMYLLVPEEGCVYDVWSFLGEEHLLHFTSQLRKVVGLTGEPTLWLSQLPPRETKQLGAAPWDEARLAASDVPDVEVTEWKTDAGAPKGCPMLAFADLGAADGAEPRQATSEGEMLVAWDLSSGPGHDAFGYLCADCGRGVIGLGTFPAGTGADLPVAFEWDDGSVARVRSGATSYGTEALLSVDGFDCTYWVWSHLGDDHLEYLLTQLHRVKGMP
jgi:hypothetical protein